EDERRFHLSGGLRFVVMELAFSEGKLGGHLWDGGILMTAWAMSVKELENERVLELGSGVGLLGISLASRAASVVLSDFDANEVEPSDAERLVPTRLLANLKENVDRNGVKNAE
ncbi:unnamed protein product, partial [Effrenium voratum]